MPVIVVDHTQLHYAVGHDQNIFDSYGEYIIENSHKVLEREYFINTASIITNGILGSYGFEIPDIVNKPFELPNDNFIFGHLGHMLSYNNGFTNITGKSGSITKVQIRNNSRNNVVIIDPSFDINGSIYFSGNNCMAVIGGSQSHRSNLEVFLTGDSQVFYLGQGSTASGLRVVVQGPEKKVIIGSDCMCAGGITLRTSDMHPIVDIETQEWINNPADILIEPHVWIGQDVIVLKGTQVGFGSILATRAVITKNVPRFSVCGGVPARVIRTGATWDRPEVPRANLISDLRAMCSRLSVPPPI